MKITYFAHEKTEKKTMNFSFCFRRSKTKAETPSFHAVKTYCKAESFQPPKMRSKIADFDRLKTKVKIWCIRALKIKSETQHFRRRKTERKTWRFPFRFRVWETVRFYLNFSPKKIKCKTRGFSAHKIELTIIGTMIVWVVVTAVYSKLKIMHERG